MTADTWPDGTWNKADEHCRAKGKQLCDYKKVCPKGRSHAPAIPGGQKKYEMWTPVRNAEDSNNPVEWVQVGTREKGDLCCLISSDCHGQVKNFQGWGKVKSFNGFIYCSLDKVIHRFYVFSFQKEDLHLGGLPLEAALLCDSKGMQLADWAELCPKGKGKNSVVPQLGHFAAVRRPKSPKPEWCPDLDLEFHKLLSEVSANSLELGKDMWTPVVNSGDVNNSIQWVQVGLRLEGDICKLISDVPGHTENFKGWGELRPYTVLETEMIGSVEVASVEFYEDGAKAEVKARADQVCMGGQHSRRSRHSTILRRLCLLVSAASSTPCCEEMGSLVHCANATSPPLAPGAASSSKTRVLVMQLATSNLWDSFCQYTAVVNARWAKRLDHRYVLTAGEYLRSSDLWRGGNVRAVLEVMKEASEEVDWIFHLDCDAALVDFSGEDALLETIQRYGEKVEVILSRDESGFAGTSRLSNMGTGLWRRSQWTLRLLETWWQALDQDSSRNEQEVLEDLLTTNAHGCLDRLILLPAGFLNSESSNPIAAPASRQPVVHLAGMPHGVRTAVFKSLWAEQCEPKGETESDPWRMRRVLVKSLADFALSLPDVPVEHQDGGNCRQTES
ncbi:unnamed protein product [Durusdinium trenchii]|uniref:DUF7495 domain-containing protein n=1 Tax=Durusdinium trenchii TaxID=1381693 RepID=A0ABP0RF53_9DINO